MSKTFRRVTTILVTLAMSVGLCIGLAACSGGGATSEEDQIRAELDKTLGTLKNPTEESLKALLGDDMSSLDSLAEQYGIDPIEMLQHFFAKFNYTIGDITVDGDNANAQVTVENVDFQKVLNGSMTDLQKDPDFAAKLASEYASGGEKAAYKLIFEKMYEAIDAAEDTVTNTVDFKLTKTDGQWNINEEDLGNLISSLYGGLDLSSL
ncbi:MAG: nuclear transport factor 2 family protein [Eggerthellaceae bacterium]|nr:nuclear transport factor 2 family protein [Eggerthellaceae bacterium]